MNMAKLSDMGEIVDKFAQTGPWTSPSGGASLVFLPLPTGGCEQVFHHDLLARMVIVQVEAETLL